MSYDFTRQAQHLTDFFGVSCTVKDKDGDAVGGTITVSQSEIQRTALMDEEGNQRLIRRTCQIKIPVADLSAILEGYQFTIASLDWDIQRQDSEMLYTETDAFWVVEAVHEGQVEHVLGSLRK